jgi:ribosomal protein S18 acetylase RimI-like enzyme
MAVPRLEIITRVRFWRSHVALKEPTPKSGEQLWTPLTTVRAWAAQAGWNMDLNTGHNDANEFCKRLTQAAVDGRVALEGRHYYNMDWPEEDKKNEHLKPIPAEHFVNFKIDPLDLLGAKTNYDIFTGQGAMPHVNLKGKIYRDLHANTDQIQKWLWSALNASSPSIRPAILQDARALADLVNSAGEGLPLYLWEKMAERSGEDPWSVGRAVVGREDGRISYRNAIIAEEDRTVAACLIGYPLSDEPEADANIPAMFIPLQQLENLAPGTWYVDVLASYPKWRKRGFGRVLLKHAEKLAIAAGVKKGISVIVADNNIAARRLYERMGYRQLADRPMVKGSWESPGSAWVLLLKEI